MRLKLGRVRIAIVCLVLVLVSGAMASAQDASVQPNAKNIAVDESLLSIDRIFAGKDFEEERLGQLTWSKSSSSYYTFRQNLGELAVGKAKS